MNENGHEPSKAIAELNAALVKAQGAMTNVAKTQEVDTGTFKYSYAPLDAIVAQVRPILAENGLALVQLLEPGPALRTELRHSAGGVLGSSFPFNAPENAKALGSMLTYIRRYALLAILNLATGEDDDGGAAGDAKPTEDKITEPQNRKMGALLNELKKLAPPAEGQLTWEGQLREDFKVESRKDMTKAQASEAIEWLEKRKADAEIPFG